MPNPNGPGFFTQFGATTGVATAGPPVAVGVPNLYDSTNVSATVAALYKASQAGGLGPPPQAGGPIRGGDITSSSALTWSGASLVATGASNPETFPGTSTATESWNYENSETSTQSMLSSVLKVDSGPSGQPAANAPQTYTGTAWAATTSYKWE